jgi:hypothetical protein
MEARFDVPGSVRLRDVSRRPAGETNQQRIERLAAKALIEGVQLVTDPRSGLMSATSASRPGVRYALNLTARTCTCDGYTSHLICKHIAYALVETGLVQPVSQPVAEPVICPDCHGQRGEKMSTGGYLSDWIWRTCSTCKGAGTV